jgi:plastocyanin
LSSDATFMLSRPVDDWRADVIHRGRRRLLHRRALQGASTLVAVALVAVLVPLVFSGGSHSTLRSETGQPATGGHGGRRNTNGRPTARIGSPQATTSPNVTGMPRRGNARPHRSASTVTPGTGDGQGPTTWVRVCSAPSVGGFGGPTYPPYCWDPDTVHAVIGQTVTWDGTQSFGGTVTYHTVTSNSQNWHVDARVYSDPSFGPGAFTYTFKTPGTYTFYCTLHNETGRVVVTDRT